MYFDTSERRPEIYTPAPPKRKASDLSRNSGEVKRLKSGGFGNGAGDGGGDQRLVPSGRLRHAYSNCERILDTLMRDPASIAYFNVPVDHIALGAFLWITHHFKLVLREVNFICNIACVTLAASEL